MEDQKFKVGERVWFQPLGWGVVTKTNDDSEYCVRCEFEPPEKYVRVFCVTGELFKGCGIQSLFRANSGVLKFDTTELPDWPVDHPIWVRDSSNSGWVQRHFSHFENGFACCFLNGLTEHTSGPGVIANKWTNYTDVDPNKGGE